MIFLLKVKIMFLKCFNGTMIKTLFLIINIEVILTPSGAFFSAKYTKSFLIFTEGN